MATYGGGGLGLNGAVAGAKLQNLSSARRHSRQDGDGQLEDLMAALET